MVRIDAHQHFWKYEPARDSWIGDDMSVIRRDFMPQDLQPLLQQHGIQGSIAVQANQSENENIFLLGLADAHPFIRGVVGWVDLQSDDLGERLNHYSQFGAMKGFRHILQSETDEAFMLRGTFRRGIAALEQYGYTYDVLIYPNHLRHAKELVTAFPNQRFVIDHIAKPFIRDRKIDGWKKEMESIATHENVHCKVSGMVTEADWDAWKTTDFTPYLDTVFEAFGSKRILFGSDWPVCLVAAPYAGVTGILEAYTSHLSSDEQAAIWGGNAISFYHLT